MRQPGLVIHRWGRVATHAFMIPLLLDYAQANISDVFLSTSGSATLTPLPTALPLFATGLGALGLLGWRRRKVQGVA